MWPTTSFLRLKLGHPFIPGASPVTGRCDDVRRAEEDGCMAIAVYSLFEEEIAEIAAGPVPVFERAEQGFAAALSGGVYASR